MYLNIFIPTPILHRILRSWTSKAAQLLCHSSTSYPLDLDFVPFHKLEMEINKIQSSLQLGSTTILEFSCLAPGVRFMGCNFILCAIHTLSSTHIQGLKRCTKIWQNNCTSSDSIQHFRRPYVFRIINNQIHWKHILSARPLVAGA